MANYDLKGIFSYHKPQEDQIPRYEAIREGAKLFAQIIVDNTPPGPDQDAAIQNIRVAAMTANASIALRGELYEPDEEDVFLMETETRS